MKPSASLASRTAPRLEPSASADGTMAVRHNLTFLRQCIRSIPVVRFFDGPAGGPYLECSSGSCRVLDAARLESALRNDGTAAILREIAPGLIAQVSRG